MADPHAAPAAPAPSNAAPVEGAKITSDDQIIADLQREHAEKVNKERADNPQSWDDVEPESEAEAEATPEPEKPKKPKREKPATKAPEYADGAAAIAAVVKALESGDPAAVARAVGKPENFLADSKQKWIHFRERDKALRGRERELTERTHDFNAKLAEARKEYGPVLEAQAAYKDGKYDRFVEMIEQITGDSYDESTRKVIKGETALSPDVKKLRKELAELRAEKQREKAEEQQRSTAERRQAEYKRAERQVAQELADHPVTKLRGYEGAVLNMVRDSWDGVAYTMSFEEAADQIVADRRAEAERLGYRPAKPAPAARPRAPEPPTRRADARPPDGDEWLTRQLSEEELVDSIVRDVRNGRIKPL